MSKPVISREQFIDEVNKRLPSHHKYRVGMRVFLAPEGASGESATGYDRYPNDAVTSGVVAAVVNLVREDFVVEPSITHVWNG
ncbi:hypothetical protein [Paraburkholderia youngii]|uniref:hypothetical protein n=1 Tax=Paraburkholderia youngii TaxID=2782701 RepID=UPI003D1F083C